MALYATIGLVNVAAFAAEHQMPADKEGKTKIPDTVEGIFKAIHEHHMELAGVVKNKKLAEVHHHAFAIRDLANALPAKAAADKKKEQRRKKTAWIHVEGVMADD